MKHLLTIILLALIIAAGVASPVYAQEGYPVDEQETIECPEWVSAIACYPGVEYVKPTGWVDGISEYSMQYPENNIKLDRSADIKAGGEGPTHFQIKGVDWRIWGFYIAMLLDAIYNLLDKWANDEPTGFYIFLVISWIILFIAFIVTL